MKTFLSFFLGVALAGVVANGKAEQYTQHEEWLTGIEYTGQGKPLFLAVTAAESHPEVVLLLMRTTADCRAPVMLLGVQTGSGRLPPAYRNRAYQGRWRVDERPGRAVSFRFVDFGGERFSYLMATGVEDGQAAYRDVTEGGKLRLKLVADDDAHVRFSLRGSRAALDRTRAFCARYVRSLANRHEDERRSGEDQRVRRDDAYSDTNPLTGTHLDI